jgi:two-component system OmpR family response regulator
MSAGAAACGSDAAPAILVADDEPSILEPLAGYLRREGYGVVTAEDAAAARRAIERGGLCLAVLDVMMPGEDGLSLTRWIRANGTLPVILLTARGEPVDRILGLEMGADDYLAKPFEPRELLARIRTVLRRAAPPPGKAGVFCFAGFTLHAAERRLVDAAGEEVPLTGGEFALLLALIEANGRVLSRDTLLDATQGRESHAFDRSVDNQISRLRKKIEKDPAQPSVIKTVRGGGYALAAQVVRR